MGAPSRDRDGQVVASPEHAEPLEGDPRRAPVVLDRPHDEVDARCARGELLELDNNASRLRDQAPVEFVESIFDIEPGEGVTWVDFEVPDWDAFFIEDEDSYYRDDDWLDPTILVVRNGPFNAGELTWYLDGFFGERFVDTDPPSRFAGIWDRRILERSGTDMVAYVHVGEPTITVALAAESEDLTTLERSIIFPVLDSFVFG